VGWTTYNSGTLDDAIRQEFEWMQIVKQAPGRRVRWILAERDGHRSISAVLSERDGREAGGGEAGAGRQAAGWKIER